MDSEKILESLDKLRDLDDKIENKIDPGINEVRTVLSNDIQSKEQKELQNLINIIKNENVILDDDIQKKDCICRSKQFNSLNKYDKMRVINKQNAGIAIKQSNKHSNQLTQQQPKEQILKEQPTLKDQVDVQTTNIAKQIMYLNKQISAIKLQMVELKEDNKIREDCKINELNRKLADVNSNYVPLSNNVNAITQLVKKDANRISTLETQLADLKNNVNNYLTLNDSINSVSQIVKKNTTRIQSLETKIDIMVKDAIDKYLIEQHNEMNNKIDEEIVRIKNTIFENINDTFKSIVEDKFKTLINNSNNVLEKNNKKSTELIKSLSNDYRKNFDLVVNKMTSVFKHYDDEFNFIKSGFKDTIDSTVVIINGQINKIKLDVAKYTMGHNIIINISDFTLLNINNIDYLLISFTTNTLVEIEGSVDVVINGDKYCMKYSISNDNFMKLWFDDVIKASKQYDINAFTIMYNV